MIYARREVHVCGGQVIHDIASFSLRGVFHYVYDLSYIVLFLAGRLSTQSGLGPLAQNSHSDQAHGHSTESGEHFISLGIPQRSINKVGGQELEGRVQLKCQPRITQLER